DEELIAHLSDSTPQYELLIKMFRGD
ncbi:MAG: hypothetical protein ACI936_003303, partial [Paraglaciecola sp.]